MTKELEIKYIELSEIIPYERNPRKNDKAVDVVVKSIKEFGFKNPILLDRNNVIVAGHTRLKAAQKLGLKKVPVIWAEDLTPEQVRAFRIMDNKSHEYAEWDFELLKQEFGDLKNVDYDLEFTGFEDRELAELFGVERDEDFDIDKQLEDAQKKELYVNEGDIWSLGEHRLIVGNSIDRKNWENLLGDEKFDFMFTDPPYKLAYTKRMRKLGGGKSIQNKTYSQVGETNGRGRFKGYVKTKQGFGFRGQRRYLGVERAGGVPEFDEWLSIANNFQNSKGANIMIFENWRNTPELWQCMEKYWKVRNMVIWWLPNRSQGFSREYFFFNKYDVAILAEKGIKPLNEEFEKEYESFLKEKEEKFVNSYEVALYGQLGKSAFNRKKKTATAKVSDHVTWTADTEAASGQNLVFGTKPIPVLISYLKVLSNPKEIIMEPFGGSGSTLIASEILGRRCRLIEIEPLYAQVIIKRWEKLTGKKAELVKNSLK